MSQLRKMLIQYLTKHNYKPITDENFIIAKGNLPICLVAHMDTVFKRTPNAVDFLYDSEQKILWHPGGAGFDDRAGIYIILQMIEKGYKPHIIFTNLEEIGGVGAQELVSRFPHCPFKCSCLIELDRANKKDMVFYDCDNIDFIKYIGKFGFQEEYGSFTDISFIMEQWGIAGVNLSVGYIDQHTANERLNTSWCDLTIQKLEKILQASPRMKKYEYVPFVPPYMDFAHRCFICNHYLDKNGYLIKGQNYIICKDCLNRYYKKDNIDFIPL